ncbi:DnaJ domain-containing protein [Opitutia bacterium ISCC 51]|nr:DnaJ domain-containing protein [Opitutae bacterium ISCC 51]QXD28652.1 DnaJ domain-containing protein [Opitutae bacterium ISCC 52]
MSKDYYSILGVLPSAEPAVITAAYKALSKLYHPDLYQGEDSHDRMAAINKAYDTLSNEEKRTEYDASRKDELPEEDPFFTESQGGSNDPFKDEWEIALSYHPEVKEYSEELSSLSSRLGFIFRITLLESKKFMEAEELKQRLRKAFLETYFGENRSVIELANFLIKKKNKEVLRELNKAVSILGDSSAIEIIKRLIEKHSLPLRWDGYQYIAYDPEKEKASVREPEYDTDSWVMLGGSVLLFIIFLIVVGSCES